MNEEHFNLIQAEIDGLNTEADSERVQKLIAGDPDLQAAFDELLFVKTAVKSLQDLEPPATLKASIMQAIPVRPAVAPVSAVSWWSAIVDMVRLPKPITLAYAFSLGMVVAFIVSTVVMPPSSEPTSDFLSGSMISSDFSGYEILGEYDLGEEEKEGRLRVARDQEQIIVEFVWTRNEPIQARVYVEEPWLGVTGSRGYERPTDFKTTTTEGEFEMEGSGPMREFISLGRRELEDNEDAEIKLEVRSGTRSLLSRSLFIRKDN